MSVRREFHLREERFLLCSPLCHPDDSVLLLESPLFEILRSLSAIPSRHITSVKVGGEAHAANCRTHSITRSHSQLETLLSDAHANSAAQALRDGGVSVQSLCGWLWGQQSNRQQRYCHGARQESPC